MRFGQILQDQYFQRFYNGKLSPVIWKRMRGTWAIPVNDIGNGYAGHWINRKEEVSPCQ